MSTININGFDLEMVFIENGGSGAGTSPTDSLGALPTPSAMTDAIYILRKDADHTWTFASGTRTNSTDNLNISIVGAPGPTDPLYDAILTSAVSGDANLNTWLTENTSGSAQVIENDGSSRQQILFNGDNQRIVMQDVDLYRRDHAADDTLPRFRVVASSTTESVKSNVYMSNVRFLQENYDMDNPGGSFIPAGRERSGLHFENCFTVSLKDFEVQAPIDSAGAYSGIDEGIWIEHAEYAYLQNVTVKNNGQEGASGPMMSILIESVQRLADLRNISLFKDIRLDDNSADFNQYVGYGLRFLSTGTQSEIYIDGLTLEIRNVDDGTDNPNVIIPGAYFTEGTYQTDIRNVNFDFTKMYNLVNEVYDSTEDKNVDFSTNNGTIGFFHYDNTAYRQGWAPFVENITVKLPNTLTTGTAVRVATAVENTLIRNVVSSRPELDADYGTYFDGLNNSAGIRVDNVAITGNLFCQDVQFVNITDFKIPSGDPGNASIQAIDASYSTIYVQNFDIGEVWANPAIESTAFSKIFIDKSEQTLDNTLITLDNVDHSNVYVNKMDTGNLWLALSNSYQGITTNVTRTSGADFALQFNQRNTNYTGSVWIAPKPFPGITYTLPTSAGGDFEFIAYGATYDMQLDTCNQYFLVEVPQGDETVRVHHSASEGVWEADDSIWSDVAIQGPLGNAYKNRIKFSAPPGVATVQVRFCFTMYESGTKYMYIDPVFVINEIV